MEEFRAFSSEEIGAHLYPGDRETFLRHYGDHLAGRPSPNRFEFRIIRRDGAIRWVEMFSSHIEYHGESAVQAALVDITERKLAEEEMKRQLMRFDLEEGYLYLVKEDVPMQSLDAFRDLLRAGYPGHVISRSPDREFGKMLGEEYNHDYRFLWLSERSDGAQETIMPPRPDEVETLVESISHKNAILFDRLDYMVFKNGIERVVSMIQHLRELSYLNNQVIILSMDPSTLETREIRLLEKEAREIRPRERLKMPETHSRMLKFIYRQNTRGIKPSYTDLIMELNSSKPTIRKHVRLLLSSGYLTETLKGRSKILELTEKGKRLFTR
jgi:DNA-binding MarR family transcriptional regulator